MDFMLLLNGTVPSFFQTWRSQPQQTVSFSVDNEGAKKEHSIEITRPFKYLCVVAQSDDDGVVSFVVAIRFSEEGSNLLVGKLSLSPEGALESALTSEDD